MKYTEYLERQQAHVKAREQRISDFLKTEHNQEEEKRLEAAGIRKFRLSDTTTITIAGRRVQLIVHEVPEADVKAGTYHGAVTPDLTLVPAQDLARAAALKRTVEAWSSGELDELPAGVDMTFAILGNVEAFARIATEACQAVLGGEAVPFSAMVRSTQDLYVEAADEVLRGRITTAQTLHEWLRAHPSAPTSLAPWSDLNELERAVRRVFVATLQALRSPAP